MRVRRTLWSTLLTTLALAPGAAAASGPPLALIAEPAAGNAPFLAMIAGARHSIELTMYELYDTRVERALAAAARRGVAVRVLLNGGYYGDREDTNASAYAYLRQHGVRVRYTPSRFALTHQKTLTVDGRRSAIMTLNLDGWYAGTRDFAVIDRRPADVAAILAVFDADWAGRPVSPRAGAGDLVWSPGAASAMLALIGSARRSIDLEDEELAYAPATDALCSAARRGVSVRIVMTYESRWQEAFARLHSCGAQIRLYHGQRYYIHAKLLLIDARQGLVGSQNLSTASLDYNRELGIELTAPALLAVLTRDFEADFTGGARYP